LGHNNRLHLTAKNAAKAGLEVCLIDRKKRDDIGEKVCGDAVGKHHFDALHLAPPKGEELREKLFELVPVAQKQFQRVIPNDKTNLLLSPRDFYNTLNNKVVGQEEAKKRDHRVLGEKLELFLTDDEVGAGLPIWMPKGETLIKVIENYLYQELKKVLILSSTRLEVYAA
jgi:threonyl-tRNA synthetase